MRELNVGWQQTMAHQNEVLASKRLAADLPAIISYHAHRLSLEIQEAITDSLTKSRTGWFDTHPSD